MSQDLTICKTCGKIHKESPFVVVLRNISQLILNSREVASKIRQVDASQIQGKEKYLNESKKNVLAILGMSKDTYESIKQFLQSLMLTRRKI